MTLQFQFVRRERETEDVYSFLFEPSLQFSFTPGQYVLLNLPHLEADSRGTERAFTIASSPAESLVRIATRLSPESSSFKRALLSLTPGKLIEASGPHGTFVLHDDEKPAVLIAGGIGITPFRSMLSELFASLDRRQVTLLYSNTTPDIPFRSFLDHLASCWPNLRVVYTVTQPSASWHGPTGRIDAEFIRRHVPASDGATFYVCGPIGMVDGLRLALTESGVDLTRIIDEGFPGYASREPANAVSSR